MKVQTKSGFAWDVDEEKAKDWRFGKHLAMCDSGNYSEVLKGITFCVPFLLGEDGEEALVKHVIDKKGHASSEKVIKEFNEIMTLIGEDVKKSESSQE